MVTGVADWPGCRHRLKLWTQAAKQQSERQADDDETRDPQKSNGCFVAETVMKREAEVDEVQHDQEHQYGDLDFEFMVTVELPQTRSTSNHEINDETSAASIDFIVVLFLEFLDCVVCVIDV